MVVLKRSFLRSLEALKVQSWIKPRSWLDVEVEWGMVGEADKRRGEERQSVRVYLQSAPQSVKEGIMSDVFPASTFRYSHCHQHSSS